MSIESFPQDSVAVIGMAGRFPGAPSLAAFWQNLRNGVESIRFFTEAELEAAGIDSNLVRNPRYVRASPMLDDIDLFDAAFFGYTAREAEMMDPQHRFFLESAYESLEDAGYDPFSYRDRIAVFGATNISTYLLSHLGRFDLGRLVDDLELLIGNDKDYLTTRVSYKLNLRGPSVNVNSACSGSLVAICLACEALLNYRCDLALAGGVAITVPQTTGYLHRDVGGGLSPDGHCRAFDANAAGTVFGSGVGVVVLKRLAEAVADRDRIVAVIRGYALNNDGSAKVGYMAPSVEGHASAVREALRMAQVDAASIGYVETHGTGTVLGDPIEVAALSRAFGSAQGGSCAIGSVKTNIGHLTAAAGVAGFIKTALALQHRELPASLNFEAPNPLIDFVGSPLFVNTRLVPWERNGQPRRAGVSALGVGGTNAHLILEEAPQAQQEESRRPAHLLVVSARSQEALDRSCEHLAVALEAADAPSLADTAYSLQIGRRSFEYRRSLAATNVTEAVQLLRGADPRRVVSEVANLEGRPVMFLFAGAGNATVATDLSADPLFAKELLAALEPVDTEVQPAVEELISGKTAYAFEARSGLTALLVLEVAIARYWMALGVQPEAVLGHSSGEYAAAVVAGLVSYRDALRMVTYRGALMDRLPRGAMLTVGLSAEALAPMADNRLSVTAINGPELCMVSGSPEDIDDLEQQLRRRQILHLRSAIAGASHSRWVDPVLTQFSDFVRGIPSAPGRLPLVSTATGTRVATGASLDADHWVRHMRQPVLFSSALEKICEQPHAVLLEIGPDQTTTSLVQRHPALTSNHVVAASLPVAGSRQPAHRYLLQTIGKLWASGVVVDWTRMYAGERRFRVALPTYPFERQRYWADAVRPSSMAPTPRSPIARKSDPADRFYVPTWRETLPVATHASNRRGETWLLFEDDLDVAAKLRATLTPRGITAISVSQGESFDVRADGSMVIDPRQTGDYEMLLRHIVASGRIVDRIVHCWGIDAMTARACHPDIVDRHLMLGMQSIAHLCRAFARVCAKTPLRLALITSNAQLVTGEEPIAPAKAAMLSAPLVLRRELLDAGCRSIDVLPSIPPDRLDLLVERLTDDVASDSTEAFVAYRGTKRWARTFEHVKLPAPTTSGALRQGGVYVITGGFGRMGLTIARMLADTFQANLVLIGRSPTPERREWSVMLSMQPDSVEARRIRAIQGLEHSGAAVLTCAADVADETQMSRALTAARRRFGRIDGVFHLAAVIGRESFNLACETTIDHCREALGAKFKGALVLQRLVAKHPPDFVVLASSIAAVLGGLGNFAYGAANASVDALAHASPMKPTRWISVNWDAWNIPDTVGAYVEGATAANVEMLASFLPLTPEEGCDALRRIVDVPGLPQIIVSTDDMQRRIAQLDGRDAASATTRHKRPRLPTADEVPRTETERAVTALWQEILGYDAVGIHDNFFELGGDSLLAVRLIARAQDLFGVELPLRGMIEEPTAAAMARAVEEVRAGGSGTEPSHLLDLKATHSARPARAQAAATVLCIPYAGGNALVYKALADALPEHIDVRVFDSFVMDEHPGASLEQALEVWQRAVTATLRGPLLLYGHCGGSVTTIELARRLEDSGCDVRAVYTGAALPPTRRTLYRVFREASDQNVTQARLRWWKWRLGVRSLWRASAVRDLERMPDSLLHDLLRKIGGVGELSQAESRSILNGFRRDAVLQWNYYDKIRRSGIERKLRCELSVVIGDVDPLTRGYEKRWRVWNAFAETVKLEVISGGGHYFISTHPMVVASILTRDWELAHRGEARLAAAT